MTVLRTLLRARKRNDKLSTNPQTGGSISCPPHSCLPFFLHASLLLFFAGLVIFLVASNTVISSVVAIVAGLTYIAYVFSTIMPIIYLACPYRTPLSNHLRVLGALLRITAICVYTSAARPFYHAAYYWCHIHTMQRSLSLSPFRIQYRLVLSSNNLKQRERVIVQANSFQILRLTANAMFWLSETTTKSSVTDVVYQSFSGFDQESTAYIACHLSYQSRDVVFHWLSALEHTSALVSNPIEDEHIVTSILHLERMSRALTKVASFGAEVIYWIKDCHRVTAKQSPVDQTISLLNQHQHLLGSHHVSALCHTLKAMYVGTFSDGQSSHSKHFLVKSTSSETYEVLLTSLEFRARESAQLWVFVRYVVMILRGINWDTVGQNVALNEHSLNRVRYNFSVENIVLRPFQGLDSHLKLLLILGEQLHDPRPISVLASSVVTALYAILYRQPLSSRMTFS